MKFLVAFLKNIEGKSNQNDSEDIEHNMQKKVKRGIFLILIEKILLKKYFQKVMIKLKI